jgi:predicted transporter
VQIVSHHTLSFRACSVCLAGLITSCAVLEPELCIPGVWAGESLAAAAAAAASYNPFLYF